MAIERYRPSGKLGPRALPLGLAYGLGSAMALAWVYQAIVDHLPFVYLSLVATMGLGLALGYVVTKGLRSGRCRHAGVAFGVAVLCGLAADAASFEYAYKRASATAYEDAREKVAQLTAALAQLPEGQEKPDLGAVEALSSLESFRAHWTRSDYIADRVDLGWHLGRRGGMEISGGLVWGAWVVEALLICILAGALAFRAARQPFCEACGQWMSASSLPWLASVDDAALEAAVVAEDLPTVLRPVAREGGDKIAQYDVHACEGCDTRYVGLKLQWKVPAGKGKEHTRTKALLPPSRVTPAEIESLRERLDATRNGTQAAPATA